MSDPNNKWDQPDAPPPPMFFGKKERDLVKQVNDELAERVIGQPIAYYPISLEESNFNDIYGEAIDKISLPPVRVYAYVEVENEQSNDRYGYEYQTKLTVNFSEKRITADQNLYVRVGDFVQYGDQFYEIVRTYNDTRFYFGQVEHKFQISAECIRARTDAFRVMPAITRPGDPATVLADGSAVPASRPGPALPVAATYITMTPESRLTEGRYLSAGSGITLTDGGRQGPLTITSTAGAVALPADSVQYNSGGDFAGSANLTFNGTTLTGSYTGSLAELTTLSASLVNLAPVSGAIAGRGSYLGLDINNNIVVTSSLGEGLGGIFTTIDGSNAYVTSSLAIGGTTAPDHQVSVSGSMSASVNISASAFYGDGSSLSGITTSPAGATTQLQYNNAGSFAGSSNLTFNGTTLTASYTGSLAELTTLSSSLMSLQPTSGSMAGPGSYLSLDADNNVVLATGDGATTSPATPVDSVQFNNAGAFGGSSNLTFNGTTLTGSYTGSLAELTTISASAGRIAGDFHIDGTIGGAVVSPADGRLVFDNQYDSGGGTTANKIVLYDSTGVSKYGIGISSGDFDFFAGPGGDYKFYNDHINEASEGTEVLTIRSDGKVGIGEILPTRQLEVVGDIYGSGSLQINDPHGSTTIGTFPMARLIGNTGSSQTPETILRLTRKGVSSTYYPAVADFNVSAYDVGGSPYGPYTQLDIALKDVGSWLESGSATIMSLRDNGNVGIGTRSPSHTLTTAGSTYLSGGLVHKHTTISTVYTASVTDYILGVSAVPTEIEVDATLFAEGQVLVIKDESGATSVTDTILLSGAAAQTIDGATTVTIESPYGSVLLYSNGSNWFIY